MKLFDMDSKEDYLLDGKYKVATPYAPLVDVVEVVRCKDCKHRIKWNDSFGCAFWGYYGDEFADGEMFCNKGERKDDE